MVSFVLFWLLEYVLVSRYDSEFVGFLDELFPPRTNVREDRLFICSVGNGGIGHETSEVHKIFRERLL